MRTFAEFQEEIKKKVPSVKELGGLGGGGGGTDSITAKSKSKSLKNRVIDAGKMATVPARFFLNIKSKPDPTEKFADSYKTPKEKVASAVRDYKKQKKVNEGVTSLAVKGGSKIAPALLTGIGAVGMIMQSKKSKGPFADTAGFDASKSRTKRQYLGLPPSSGLTKQQKKNRKIKGQQEIIKRRDDKIATEGPGDLVPGAKRARLKKLLKGYLEKSGIKAKRDANKKINRNLGKRDTNEEVMAAPTNNVGGGKIAGTVEAGDDPPVKKKKKKGKKKKRYIYGGRGSRKMWMPEKDK